MVVVLSRALLQNCCRMALEELVMVLVVAVVVVVIVATLILGLWLYFGREITYEEAMASKMTQVEAKEKVTTAIKPKKRKQGKKKSDSESTPEDEEKSAQQHKPILKAVVEKAGGSKVVDFDVQTPPPKKTERPPLSPPTPHPTAMDPARYASLLGTTEDDEVAPANGIDTERAGEHASESLPLKESIAASVQLPSLKSIATPAPAKKAKAKKRLTADYGRAYGCLHCVVTFVYIAQSIRLLLSLWCLLSALERR